MADRSTGLPNTSTSKALKAPQERRGRALWSMDLSVRPAAKLIGLRNFIVRPLAKRVHMGSTIGKWPLNSTINSFVGEMGNNGGQLISKAGGAILTSSIVIERRKDRYQTSRSQNCD